MLEWIGLAAGIGFGIMGLAAYIKTNLEGRQREQELLDRIEQLHDTIRRGQLLEFEKIVPEQKRLIRDAQRSIWIFSINSLGLFHEHREDMISLLKKGGSMRVLLLDPASEVFKNRERKEEEEINGQISGRLRAEYMASVAYCKDIINFSEGKGSLELRLHKEDINEVLLIIDPGTGNTTLHINEYSPERHTRGYTGKHRIIPREQPDLIKPYIQRYENLWNNARRVDL
ncbi:hypothetical protein CW713_04500 [Methanophagales archaeon]|nr:MAG: hypothetical protein CW713_04500 [Methanophagales archaeon]